jgi:predicted O-methyltransferase YrrM
MLHQLLKSTYRMLHSATRSALNSLGLNVALTKDFYSPLPVLSELARSRKLWDQPSELVGVRYDLEAMQELLSRLTDRYLADYQALPSFEEIKALQFGPGFPVLDGMTIFLMLRDLKPKRYIEIGSGLSTYYSWLAASKNAEEGQGCKITCIDPYPTGRLWSLSGVDGVEKLVQEVEPGFFSRLESGDVLFIDSTHVLKIGGDVAHLFLEVLPRLNPGVVVHVHDIHFPYNTPYPAEQYIFQAKWPLYRTEAMILQAFLSFNAQFEILFSAPMLRHSCEEFLQAKIPDYQPVETADYDTHFGSFWFRRIE